MNVHLIGVCGTAMATVAALLKRRGHYVRGSDEGVYPPMDEFLAREDIPVLIGYKPEHITADLSLVIVGNAISRGNPELEEVLDRKIRHCSLPEAIREHFLWGARSIVIAGTHGKTTTAALTGWLLAHAALDPTVLVGGIALNFGDGGSSYRVGSGREFVIEGDEYDSAFFDKTAKFLKYLPDIALVNNIEFDHADIYVDLDAVRLAFRRLVNLVPRSGLLLLGSDSPDAAALRTAAASPVETFGLHDRRRLAGLRSRSRRRHHAVQAPAPARVRRHVRVAAARAAQRAERGRRPGRSAARSASRPARSPKVCDAFRGVKRRLEVVARVNGVTVYDDFAHHPTAVAETIAAVRAGHPGRRVWAVFEPRSASSCRRVFQDDFARAFVAADETVLARVYRSSLPEDQRLSVDQLVADLTGAGRSARHIDTIEAIIDTIVREHARGRRRADHVERRVRRHSPQAGDALQHLER